MEDFDSSSTCNRPNYSWDDDESTRSTQDVLAHWGTVTDPHAALSEEEVRSEIDAERPFVMAFEWTLGGGHALVGRGILGDNMYFLDPWPDEGYQIRTYDWVVSSWLHEWVNTLVIRPSLTIELTAAPDSGTAPLSTTLSALPGGTATGSLNYTFWWDCPSTSVSVSDTMAVCGTIPTPSFGACASNAYGYKCNGVTDDPKAVGHTYSAAGTYTAKVIVERGTAPPVQAQAVVSTSSNQPLSVGVSGNGSVTSSSGGINCPGACWASYMTGTTVVLTPHTGIGATFTGWGGDCWGAGSCALVMGSPHNVTATFTGSTGPHTLTVSKTGTGSGTVTSNPNGISCGSTCSKSFAAGTLVTLTANPAGGSTFAGWTGACSAASACNVSMSAAKNVTATFTQEATSPRNPGSLIALPNGDVYWRQLGRVYHVTHKATVVDVMEAAGMPGWVWADRIPVSSLAGYAPRPEFLEGDGRSEGLLIRQVGHDEVYWINNGKRRWVACEEALASLGASFADVVEVPAAIISSKVPSTTSDYNNGCPCTGFSIFPSSPAPSPDSSAGSQLVTITGVPWECAGTWTTSGNGDWLTVSPPSGSLSGSDTDDPVYVQWSENASPSSRSSHATIGDRAFPVTQPGAPPPTCSTFEISPTHENTGPAAGHRSVTITGYPSGCEGKSWTASSGSWVSVTPSAGSGPRSVTVSWDQNTVASSRVESVTIAGNTFTVSQDRANQPPVANAGLDQIVPVAALVKLSGGGSSDSDAGPRPLSFAWSQVSGPAVAVGGAATMTATFTPPSEGTYVFELRVSDGDAQATDQVSVEAAPGVATHDPALWVPKCGSVGSVCDSGSLLVGRAGLGPEPHQPNTIYSSCADSTSGVFHDDESNDRIRVSTLDGGSFAKGKVVQVEATVWAWDDPSLDRLEIYHAADAHSPDWTLVATLVPPAADAQTLSTTYELPAGSLQAVRARFRYLGSAGACGNGSYDDHDDLVFAVGPATTNGWISGRVIDAETSEALSGVQVTAFDGAGWYVGEGVSNSSGFYVVPTGPASETYFARTASGLDYVDELYDGFFCPGGGCTVTTGTPISVTAGTTTSGIDFALGPAGRISGTVRDAGSGLPIANVSVYIFSADDNYVGSTSTDASGIYTFGGLPSGVYYARAWGDPAHYISELYDDIPCPDMGCLLAGGAPINVTAGSTTSGIDFDLVQGGRILGTVTDVATGLPLRVYVAFYDAGGAWVTTTLTNPYGDFRTPALHPGTYYALTSNSLGYVNQLYDAVDCPDGSCFVTSGTPIFVMLGDTTSRVDFALAQGGRISGQVTDAGTALPLSDQWVQICDSAGDHVAWLTTDSSGSYTSSGLPSGTYHARTTNTLGYVDELYDDIPCPAGSCSVTGGTPIAVTVGSTTSAVDFALLPGGRISGTVTDEATGLPLAGVWVYVYDSIGNWVTWGSSDGYGDFVTSDGLPSGTYHALTSNSLGYVDQLYDGIPCPAGTCSATDGAPIVVSDGTTAGVDFALAQGGGVTGTVTDAGTGLPLSGVWVYVYDQSGNRASYDTTDSAGAYVIGAVPAGTYYARTSNALGYVDELYEDAPCVGGACTVTSGSPVPVTAGLTTADIDFALEPGGRISGTVTDASTGLPLANSRVAVYGSTGSYLTYAYTDSSGEYTTASGLVSGTYHIRTTNSQGYLEELYDDIPCSSTCTVTAGMPVSVTLGSTTPGIDFALDPGGRISGTVKDAATGLPLPGVWVSVYDSQGGYATYGYTDSAGVYTSYSGLPSGTYRVRTSSHSDYVDEVHDDLPCPGGSCNTTIGAPVSVTAGVMTSAIDFALAKGGRINGLVTDAVSGGPLVDVVVRIHDASGTSLASVTTNASGFYTSPALPTGAYHLRTSNLQGYVDELYDDVPCAGGTCTVTAGTALTALAGATTSGIDFGLASGARVSGTVTDAVTGLPVVGAQVRVLDADGGTVAIGTADATGIYTTSTGLPAGTYFARASAPGYVDELYDNLPCPRGSCPTTSGAPLEVTAGSTMTGVDFALEQAAAQTNDEIAGAMLIAGLPYSSVEDTRTATTNPTDPVHTCATGTQDSNSVWFRYVATFTGTLRVDTLASNYDTVLSAYPGSTSVGPELACNDDTNGQQSEILFGVTSGENYLIEVTDYGTPNGGTLVLSVAPAPPAVTTGFATGIDLYEATLTGWANPRGTSTTTAFDYGTSTGYGATVEAETLTGTIAQAFSAVVSGLQCGTTYHFRAAGTNGGGTASGVDVAFVTAACPELSIADASPVREGDLATSFLDFVVSLSPPLSTTVTASYHSLDGTAEAGADYTPASGDLTFEPGVTTQTISVEVLTDELPEPHESVLVRLTSPSGATISRDLGEGLIEDDDSARCDLDGDGRSDVLWRDADGLVRGWLMAGASVAQAADLPAQASGWRMEGVGDFDADGRSDLLWRDTVTGQTEVWLMNGLAVESSVATTSQNDQSWQVTTIADLDGDGRSDIVWRHRDGTLNAWFMNGNVVTGSSDLPSGPADARLVGSGDFDGDGRDDLLWLGRPTGIHLWLMNGSVVTEEASLGVQPGSAGRVRDVGDLDGDGKADIIWSDALGRVGVSFMNGTSVSHAALLPLLSRDWVIAGVGDFDDDGRDDLLLRDRVTGATSFCFIDEDVVKGAEDASVQMDSSWTIMAPSALGPAPHRSAPTRRSR